MKASHVRSRKGEERDIGSAIPVRRINVHTVLPVLGVRGTRSGVKGRARMIVVVSGRCGRAKRINGDWLAGRTRTHA